VPSLLPPNSTLMERGLEGTATQLLDIPVPLDTLWNPAKIDISLLPWLAWSLSVDSWKSYWSDDIKRNRVAVAIDVARHKGTAKAVKDVVAAFGGYVSIREWWQMTPPGKPHTFELFLTVAGAGGTEATADFVDDIIAEVQRTKPVRSHFTFTQGVQVMGGVGLIAAARPVIYARLLMTSPVEGT
jgi:phage tail P2-like protein